MSPDFLVWKFNGKALCLFKKFLTRKLGEITIFYALKDIKTWEITKKIKNTHIANQCFPGDKGEDKEHYVKPAPKRNANIYTFHAGTSDPKSESTPKEIAQNLTPTLALTETKLDDPFILVRFILNATRRHAD